MTGVSKAEHVHVMVEDVAAATEFYTDVMGLVEIAETDDVVYMGCGLDENYDLAVEAGGTGVEHFAMRVAGEEALKEYEERLRSADVSFTRQDGTEPSQESGVRFDLPSGVTMELVVVSDTEYWHTADPALRGRAGHTPLDLDHHNLKTSEIDADHEFLRDTIGYDVSDVVETEGGDTIAVFIRDGDFHHDIGLTTSKNRTDTLSHVGWEMRHVEHMVDLTDRMAAAGVRLELGLSRHTLGDNVFAYFWEPGGNRFEISTGMATLDDDTPTTHLTVEDIDSFLSAWGGIQVPQSFYGGS